MTVDTPQSRSVVVDGCAPLMSKPGAWRGWMVGGVDLAVPTVATHENPGEALKRVGEWRRWMAEEDGVFHVASPTDLDLLGRGRLGVAFHFQDTAPLGENLNLVEAYRDLGVRMIQLTYNDRNAVGGGCMDLHDGGLTAFGRELIGAMNQLGIVVDLSHGGDRTTLEAIEASSAPAVFSHSNVRRLFNHPRNITDRQIRAVAQGGGLVGVNAVASFLRADGKLSTLSDLLDHIDCLVEMIGADHVCLGLDFWSGPEVDFEEWNRTGRWSSDDLSGFVDWPTDISGPGHFPRLREGLASRGHSTEDIAAIMGDNWARLFRRLWT
ncbi:MAG: membrane dipeptidase [bacterium]|nr:membrane dipeptidase [bacterium]